MHLQLAAVSKFLTVGTNLAGYRYLYACSQSPVAEHAAAGVQKLEASLTSMQFESLACGCFKYNWVAYQLFH